MGKFVFFCNDLYVRVDPTAVCEGKTITPMDYAAEKENLEMISLLAEFTEMPDHIKLLVLSKLMYKSEHKAKEKEEFKNLLSSLSVELVSPLHCLACIHLFRVVLDYIDLV